MKLLLFSCFLLANTVLWAQQIQPVKWSFAAEETAERGYDLIFTAHADPGWYIYSQFLDDGGPIPTSFNFSTSETIELIGPAREVGHKKEGFDKIFEMKVAKFGGKTKFIQSVKVPAGTTEVTGFLTFMTCNDEICLPPVDIPFKIQLK